MSTETPPSGTNSPEPEEERFLIGADQYALDAAPKPAKLQWPPRPGTAPKPQESAGRPPELASVEAFKAKYKGMIPDAELPAAYQRALTKQMGKEAAERLARGAFGTQK